MEDALKNLLFMRRPPKVQNGKKNYGKRNPFINEK
jgi:hypothetical protein